MAKGPAKGQKIRATTGPAAALALSARERDRARELYHLRQFAGAVEADAQLSQISLAVVKGGEYTFDVRASGRNLDRVRQQAQRAFRLTRSFIQDEKKRAAREHDRDERAGMLASLERAELKRKVAAAEREALAAERDAAAAKELAAKTTGRRSTTPPSAPAGDDS